MYIPFYHIFYGLQEKTKKNKKIERGTVSGRRQFQVFQLVSGIFDPKVAQKW
jgi:hypothetical protein